MLERATQNDASFVLSLRSSERAAGRLHPVTEDLDVQKAWIRDRAARVDDFYFVVKDVSSKKKLGLIGVYGIDFASREGEWGRWILAPGSVAAPESAYLILRFAFEDLGLARVRSRTVASNRRVLNFHESLGLGAGVVSRLPFDFGGEHHHAIEHSIEVDEWPAVKCILEDSRNAVAALLQRRTGLRSSTSNVDPSIRFNSPGS